MGAFMTGVGQGATRPCTGPGIRRVRPVLGGEYWVLLGGMIRENSLQTHCRSPAEVFAGTVASQL
jgi:hypothetical protein